MKKETKKQTQSPKRGKIIWIISSILVISFILLYGRFIATTGLIVKEYKIVNNNLPNSYHGLKIVHISDIHYGKTIDKKDFNKMVSKINIINPDIVVLTGDLFDQDVKLSKDQIKEVVSGLKNINAKINKYAIMGNHDYSHDEWQQVIEAGDFIDLNENYDLIYNNSYEPIMISGMSTNLNNNVSIKDKLKNINDYLDNLKPSNEIKGESEKNNIIPKYKIMIMHEPDFIDKFNYNEYDLILAGHSHNGQIRFPLIGAVFLPEGAQKYYQEYYPLKNTDLYISSGTGTSTIKFRLFNRPSINFYRLTNR